MNPRPLPSAVLVASVLAFALPPAARGQAAAAAPAKPAVIKPADNLVTDGIPDLPAEIAETVGRYTEFRSASLAGWHPVKREMLISTRFGDTPQVHEVRMPGGARRQLTFFPDRVGGASWPRHAADYFVFGKDRGGRRVQPDLPPRRRHRRDHDDLGRRPLAELPRPLVARR